MRPLGCGAQRAARACCDQHEQRLSFRGVGFARAAAGGAPRPWQCACKASRSRHPPRPILIAPSPRRGSALLAPYAFAASRWRHPPRTRGPAWCRFGGWPCLCCTVVQPPGIASWCRLPKDDVGRSRSSRWHLCARPWHVLHPLMPVKRLRSRAYVTRRWRRARGAWKASEASRRKQQKVDLVMVLPFL